MEQKPSKKMIKKSHVVPRAAKSSTRAAKSLPRAAQERPRAAPERPREAKRAPGAAKSEPRGPQEVRKENEKITRAVQSEAGS